MDICAIFGRDLVVLEAIFFCKLLCVLGWNLVIVRSSFGLKIKFAPHKNCILETATGDIFSILVLD